MIAESELHPRVRPIELHWETYVVAKKVLLDYSFPTFDRLVREMLRKEFPMLAADL
jgi:hypothetical protein